MSRFYRSLKKIVWKLSSRAQTRSEFLLRRKSRLSAETRGETVGPLGSTEANKLSQIGHKSNRTFARVSMTPCFVGTCVPSQPDPHLLTFLFPRLSPLSPRAKALSSPVSLCLVVSDYYLSCQSPPLPAPPPILSLPRN